MATSGMSTNEKKPMTLIVNVTLSKSVDGHSSTGATITVKTVEVVFPESLLTELNVIDTKLESIYQSRINESARLDKIGKLLSNMDREERRARALLVGSKLKGMKGGDSMLAALTSGLPEV